MRVSRLIQRLVNRSPGQDGIIGSGGQKSFDTGEGASIFDIEWNGE